MADAPGGPLYYPTSVNAGVGGDVHDFARYRNTGGVVGAPLQRAGAVPMNGARISPAQGANPRPSLGDGMYPAGKVNMQLPPVNNIVGSPRDGNFQV